MSIPTKLESFNGEKVKAISSGPDHSMALTESGHLFAWGCNRFGHKKLVISRRGFHYFSPQIIEIKGINIKTIIWEYDYSLLLSYEESIYIYLRWVKMKSEN